MKIDADSNRSDPRRRRSANAPAGPKFAGGRPPSLPQADGDPEDGSSTTLGGSVPDNRTKWLAEDCVLAVPGVRDVHDNLRAGRSFGGRERS